MKNSIITVFSIVLFSSSTAAGCDVLNSDSDLGSSEEQVQMQVWSVASSTARQQLVNNEIQEVKHFVDEMEIESVSDASYDFEDGYLSVNLPLDGSAMKIPKRNIQPDFYDEFDLEVL